MIKIKLLFSLFLFSISALMIAQNNQFVYDYKFKMDSTNRDKVENEIMLLETSSEGSKFYSYVKYVYDSTMTATLQKAVFSNNNNFDFTGLKSAKVKSSITKKYPELTSLLRTNIGDTPLVLENKDQFNWKISKEKDKILGHEVQKATTDFEGRKWIAWFASDLPIQDGPYRFSGLPGLILKLEDSKGDHIFTVVAVKKNDASLNQKINYSKSGKEIQVDHKKFNKLWNDYKKDPAKDLRTDAAAGSGSAEGYTSVSLSFTDESGKTFSGDDLVKEIEKDRLEEIKNENNFLDLKLYK